MKHLFRWMAALTLLICAAGQSAMAADDFLPPEQAFKLSADLRAGGTVHLAWAIAPGYHLYRDRLVFAAPQVGQPALPDGLRKFDSNFNKEMETYAGRLAADLPVSADAH
jgi:thiol:disulfide interchange protein DsbD